MRRIVGETLGWRWASSDCCHSSSSPALALSALRPSRCSGRILHAPGCRRASGACRTRSGRQWRHAAAAPMAPAAARRSRSRPPFARAGLPRLTPRGTLVRCRPAGRDPAAGNAHLRVFRPRCLRPAPPPGSGGDIRNADRPGLHLGDAVLDGRLADPGTTARAGGRRGSSRWARAGRRRLHPDAARPRGHGASGGVDRHPGHRRLGMGVAYSASPCSCSARPCGGAGSASAASSSLTRWAWP